MVDATGDIGTFERMLTIGEIIRQQVFVDELKVPAAEEFDGLDRDSRHVFGLREYITPLASHEL